jgi:hypothetical protein
MPRKAIVTLILLAMTALTAPRAGAALPKTAPSQTLRCANGKTAKVWTEYGAPYRRLSLLAAENPCKDRWLAMDWPGESESDPYGDTIFLAPGKRFNWDEPHLSEWGMWEYEYEDAGASLVLPKDACVSNYETEESGLTSFSGSLVYGYNDVRDAPECGQPPSKYGASRYASAQCPYDDNTASLTWKMDGKKVIKLEMRNDCSGGWAIAWWRLKNGRTQAVWIEPGVSADLWKSELDPIFTDTADGKVHFGMDADFGADWDDISHRDPKKRPFYYNGGASG